MASGEGLSRKREKVQRRVSEAVKGMSGIDIQAGGTKRKRKDPTSITNGHASHVDKSSQRESAH